MDVLASRLEKLKRLRLEQNIGVSGLEFECCKNDIRFDLLVCGGSLDLMLSVCYWSMAYDSIPPITLVFSALLFYTVYDYNFPDNNPLEHILPLERDSTPLCDRIEETLQAYAQLLVWPKIFVYWCLSIRKEHSALFYLMSSGFFLWLYQIGDSISGAMALYLLMLIYLTFPMIGITVCFDWMMAIGSDIEESSIPPEESLLPEATEENARLWELNAAADAEEQQLLEEFQPSLTGLALRTDEDDSLVMDLRLDPAHIPDINDTDSSSSLSETQNMNFSIHHFSSSSDTGDNITPKQDARKDTAIIPPARKTRSSKLQSEVPATNRDSDEEGLDVGSFEMISREEFNL